MEKKLYRDEHRKVVGGVCAGLADYFNVDVSIVRLVFLLALILKGGGGLIYIILWIVLPKKDYTIIPPVDYSVPPVTPYQQPYNAYQNPVPPVMPPSKRPTTAALIGGLILIILGAGLLVDEFDLIPDLHFDQWWPVILVVIGLVLIVNRNSNHPAATQWQQPEVKKDVNETTSDDTPKTEL